MFLSYIDKMNTLIDAERANKSCAMIEEHQRGTYRFVKNS